jgi:hypothetical protein
MPPLESRIIVSADFEMIPLLFADAFYFTSYLSYISLDAVCGSIYTDNTLFQAGDIFGVCRYFCGQSPHPE